MTQLEKVDLANKGGETEPPAPGPAAKRQSGRNWRWPVFITAGLLAVVALVVVGYALAVRPWYMTIGSTAQEQAMTLPGDELIANPASKLNMAITIKAPAEEVWPWLVQIGNYRGGWYSYDAVENALGSADFIDGHSLNRIAPELQNLKVGDRIDITWKDAPLGLQVVQLEPNRALVMRWANNGKVDGPTWVYALQKIDDQTTRLITRALSADSPDLPTLIMEPGEFVMYHKTMVGIKERAERAWQGKLTAGAVAR